EMGGAAAHAGSGFKRLALHVQALERRQQRWVDVDQPVLPAGREPRAEDAHESGQDDQFDAMALQFRRDGAIEALAVGVVAMRNDGGGDARRGRNRETWSG